MRQTTMYSAVHIPSVIPSPHLFPLRKFIPLLLLDIDRVDVLLGSMHGGGEGGVLYKKEPRSSPFFLLIISYRQHLLFSTTTAHQTKTSRTYPTQPHNHNEDFDLPGNRLHRNPPPLLRPRGPHRLLRCLRSNRRHPLRNRLLHLPPSQIRR